jgi:HSP20 family molecular chaperone IbpA
LAESYYIEARHATEAVMAGNFLMEHNFSPRWTNPRQRQEVPRARRDSDEGHRRFSLDSFARILHGLNVHHDEESGGHAEPKVHPLFDLIEGPDDFKIYGDLPGMTSDDLHVDVNDHMFTISVSGKFEVPHEIAILQAKEDTVPITHRDASGPGIKVEEAKSEPAEGKEEPVGSTSAEAPAKPEPAEIKPEPAKPLEEEAGKVEAKEEVKKEEAKKEEKKEEPKIKYHIHERKLGSFRRAFQFPIEVVSMEKVTAQCKNGLLTISVPKNPSPIERKGRKLDVV